jgi:hypothetical protein
MIIQDEQDEQIRPGLLTKEGEFRDECRFEI